MKNPKLISFIAATFTLVVTISAINGSHPQSQDTTRFGIEITTNVNEEPLYVPVSLSEKKGRLFATVPVKSGDDVSAVRIAPVMQKGKVKLDLYLISGDFWKAQSCADLQLLPNKQIESLVALYGETVTVNGNSADAGPLVSIKVVALKPARNFQTDASESIAPGAGPCGCATCGRQNPLYCCPNRGQCIGCGTCGEVCCPNGE